jgi:hypothetical protein
VPEAQLEDSGSGLAPITEGWFVVNARDAEWWFTESRGALCNFENEYGRAQIEFAQLGINVTVLEPGQSGLYHAESGQEAFLVVSGGVQASRRGGGATPPRVGFLPLSALDRTRFRGRGREALRDRHGRFAVGDGGALPRVGARGPVRRERGGGDLRLEAGVRGDRPVPARAAHVLGSSALGVPATRRMRFGMLSQRN